MKIFRTKYAFVLATLLITIFGNLVDGRLIAQEESEEQLIYLPVVVRMRDLSTISPTGPYLGEVVEVGGYSFAALSLVGLDDPSPGGNQLLEFEVILGNVSSERIVASGHSIRLKDFGGREYSLYRDSIYPHRLEPGERVKGKVSFLLPLSVIPEEIIFKVPGSSVELISKTYTQTGGIWADPNVPLTNGPPIDKGIDSKLGDLIQKGEYSLQALTIQNPGTVGNNDRPIAGKQLIDIKVVVGNMTDQYEITGPGAATLIDSEGYAYRAESFKGEEPEGVFYDITVIRAGKEVQGWLSFMIPEDALIRSLKLKIYGDSYFVLETGLEE